MGPSEGCKPRCQPHLTGSSAVLLVADIERSAEYHRKRLGFTCEVYGDPLDFIVATRDDATILMARCEDPVAGNSMAATGRLRFPRPAAPSPLRAS